ncbi:hypothetical protein EOPP23_13025 [Endozoicomonas sp. OPT23]|uniref:flagellar motor protein MotB n=1 Tax=Endozoicomonas sp. OPT23 TaxID=2072845 RepID=UPI00129AA763|nr:flagellar motor protein MotB [Endozoicomonas sp. OPT23]MRI33911.1 hypothetical protein [Endozoicomonas sp. OPT23]
MNKNDQIIIIKRGKKKKHRAHSSAWKIAFADFTLSMMAVFLVLWVVSMSTSDEQEEIAKYFNDPGGYYDSKGYESVIDFGGGINDNSMVPDMGNIVATPEWSLYLDMEDAGFSAILDEFKSNISMKKISVGVQINISENYGNSMFSSGGRHLDPYYEDLLLALAPYLEKTRRPIAISGHSDSTPFSSGYGKDNWELSSQRANEARKTLVYGGLTGERIVRLSAKADTQLLYPDQPLDPKNRRIEIVVIGEAGNDYEYDDEHIEPTNSMETIGANQALRRALSNQLK